MINSISSGSNLQASMLNKTNIKKDIQQDISNSADNSKVSNIKNAIENGTYELDIKKTAKAIVDTLA